MKILDKYIAKQVLLSILAILGILVVVVGLLDLVDEIKKNRRRIYNIACFFIRIIKYTSEYL